MKKTPSKVTIHPCAKINLGLTITGKRPDGYHTLETLFLPVQLYDTLSLYRRKRKIILSCDPPVVPDGPENLVLKAVEKYFTAWNSSERVSGVSILLKKRIPVGGGLGGGSSDAAYTLRGLQQLFGYPLNENHIRRLAVELGADVPFFLESRACLAGGIGDILIPYKIEIPGWIVLAWPDVSISTKEVFRDVKFNLTKDNSLITLFTSQKLGNIYSVLSRVTNELELVVFPKYPQLERLKESFFRLGAEYASLSGSGSTVYGLFPKKNDAEHAAHFLSPQNHTVVTRQHLPIHNPLR